MVSPDIESVDGRIFAGQYLDPVLMVVTSAVRHKSSFFNTWRNSQALDEPYIEAYVELKREKTIICVGGRF